MYKGGTASPSELVVSRLTARITSPDMELGQVHVGPYSTNISESDHRIAVNGPDVIPLEKYQFVLHQDGAARI